MVSDGGRYAASSVAITADTATYGVLPAGRHTTLCRHNVDQTTCAKVASTARPICLNSLGTKIHHQSLRKRPQTSRQKSTPSMQIFRKNRHNECGGFLSPRHFNIIAPGIRSGQAKRRLSSEERAGIVCRMVALQRHGGDTDTGDGCAAGIYRRDDHIGGVIV